MTWREATVCRLLLLVAIIVGGDAELKAMIQNVANHISVGERERV